MKQILPFLLLISSLVSTAVAQVITPLSYNHAIKKQIVEASALKSTATKKITPPFPDDDHYFFDDFSSYHYTVYPDENLWVDASAFINQTYADSSISLGAATLDGVDKNGDLYSTTEGSFPSDTLTSIDISLEDVVDSLFFSFFYQGGGKGDYPNENDSLILEFYNATSEIWYEAWFSLGYESHIFEQVVIPVDDSLLSSAFKFRFRNRTSTDFNDAVGQDEDGIANSDLWNLDYIQLKIATSSDEMHKINDVSFVNPLLSTHSYYHSLPYNHLTYSQGDRRSTSNITVRTYFYDYQGSEPSITVNRTHETYNIYNGDQTLVNGTETLENEQDFLEFRDYSDFFTPGYYKDEDQEYGLFEYISFIDVEPEQYRWNDTVKKVEVFKDYYAYDDGTAEYGFGLSGKGGTNMRLAYKYPLAIRNTNPTDTLTAIDFHFVKSRNNESVNVEFKVCVWETNGDEPGDLIYPQLLEDGDLPATSYYPDTTLGINEFMRIELEEELILKDTIFIGLVQISNGTLGIGYDVNSESRSSIYTNSGNGWLQTYSTIPEGAIMMRPVFGNHNYLSVDHITAVTETSELFRAYPSPVNDILTIDLLQETAALDSYIVSVYNIMGKCMINEQYVGQSLDFSNYPQGMYFLRILNSNTSEHYTQKILKQN